jgi:S-formylglutathione hydrolase FrmB
MAMIQASFFSECLKRKVHFNAILPVDPMFPEMYRPPLKTAYLLHGYTGSCDDWFTRHSLGNLSLRNNLAIILPNAENHFYVDDMQREDMYGEFIGKELVEFTRKVFPLSEKRDDTIIGGISMGGYGSLRNGMKYNDVFGHVVAIAPAIILNEVTGPDFNPSIPGVALGYYESVFGDLKTANERDVSVFWLSKKMKDEGAEFPDIYFACGANDRLVYENRRFHAHLTELGIPHVYEEAPGTHDELFFDPYLMAGFARLDLDRLPVMQNPLWVD